MSAEVISGRRAERRGINNNNNKRVEGKFISSLVH